MFHINIFRFCATIYRNRWQYDLVPFNSNRYQALFMMVTSKRNSLVTSKLLVYLKKLHNKLLPKLINKKNICCHYSMTMNKTINRTIVTQTFGQRCVIEWSHENLEHMALTNKIYKRSKLSFPSYPFVRFFQLIIK